VANLRLRVRAAKPSGKRAVCGWILSLFMALRLILRLTWKLESVALLTGAGAVFALRPDRVIVSPHQGVCGHCRTGRRTLRRGTSLAGW
jgi:predicted Rdx family selenoprotein